MPHQSASQQNQHADSLIHARWIIPIEGDQAVLEHHSLAIKDGAIIAILPTAEATQQFQADEEFNLDQHALLPGFINSHGHAAMSLLRGYADDLPLMTWLQEHIWPCEGRYVDEQFVKDGTELAIAEMIKSGTTCFSDNYFYPGTAGEAAIKAGIRAQLCFPAMEFPTNWAQNADEYIDKGLVLVDQFKDEPLVEVIFGPHAPYSLSDKSIQRIVKLSKEHNIRVQMHIHESAPEIEQSLKEFGKRPLERLLELGLINDKLQAVHMTQLTDSEIEMVARHGVSVVHCPESNLKLASGFCPAHKLMEAGVNLAIGTDGCASNNDLDMLGETRTAAFLAKAVAMEATALNAEQALTAATLGGAKAMGIDPLTGSLRTGKAADITAIDLSHIACQPMYNPISQIVYSCSRDQVSHVWVNGNNLLREQKLTRMDEQKLHQVASKWRQTLAGKDKD